MRAFPAMSVVRTAQLRLYAGCPKRSVVPSEHKNALVSLHFQEEFDTLIENEYNADKQRGIHVHPPSSINNISSVRVHNTVMPQRMFMLMSSASRRRRIAAGAHVYSLTGDDNLHLLHKQLIELASTPNTQFACNLISQRQKGSGTTMQFEKKNMVRAGKSRPGTAMRELTALLGYADCPWHATISVPNMVCTTRFTRPFGTAIKTHYLSNETADFSGVYVNLKNATRCTPGMHMAKNKVTGEQRKSNAVIPGARNVTELFECLKELNSMSEECSLERQTVLADN